MMQSARNELSARSKPPSWPRDGAVEDRLVGDPVVRGAGGEPAGRPDELHLELPADRRDGGEERGVARTGRGADVEAAVGAQRSDPDGAEEKRIRRPRVVVRAGVAGACLPG